MPIRVCCVALNAYPAIDPDVPGGIGGIETRSWMFARGLAARGDCEVTFVVRHWQPLRQPSYNGVRLKLLRDRLYAARESLALRLQRTLGFPWLKLREPRLSDALYLPLLAIRKMIVRQPDPCLPARFFEEIPADVFLTFGVQSNSATVIASAHATGRPAVLFLGSDGDLDERYLTQSNFVSVYRDSAAACKWAIENADGILCQTPSQQSKLAAFGRTATIVPNPIDLKQWDDLLQHPRPVPEISDLNRYVLWIGRAESEHKRPLDCVELARRCPDLPFLMILNRRDDVVEAEVRRTAPSNVRIIERVSFPSIPGIMQRAAVLVNTSSLEGFPNTFLQAAATSVPVASLNVEREFLARSQAGVCADGSLDRLAQQVRELCKMPRDPAAAAFARQYVELHHSLDAQVDQLLQQLTAFASSAIP
ncbi:glycosyltransferase family 4 protein [Planctomicrobium piriforme]|uniref:Glycosyltransferase involved in cell wall bisynthesis n=1 Tax=Planctomicrobium piriforme TaxID=1576369 RepID=A0A1I3M2S0_9PLAN|nr:glycosyltransferase family 4 protein [Planctomicrobium piriforme]SFI91331.1 Glycosyltransferase involved in cell wall bisynthesis [Planctomicrobium piriforme]